jgi:hypothetical protein
MSLPADDPREIAAQARRRATYRRSLKASLRGDAGAYAALLDQWQPLIDTIQDRNVYLGDFDADR